VICSGISSFRCRCSGRGGGEGGRRRIGTRGSGSRSVWTTEVVVRGLEGGGRDRNSVIVIFIFFVVISSLRLNVGF